MAQVHPIFAKQEQAGPPSAPHPLVLDLRRSTATVLNDLLQRMFDQADDWLFESGEQAPGDAERRHYFDTMRVLRLGRNSVLAEFSKVFEQGFAPGSLRSKPELMADVDALAIQPTEELEYNIALGNLAARAEGLFKDLIWEVEQRLKMAAQQHFVPVSPVALIPQSICAAFGNALDSLDTEFQIKLVVFKLFERSVIAGLDRVYHEAQAALTRHGFGDSPRRVATSSAPRAEVAQGAPALRMAWIGRLMEGLPDEVDLAPSTRDVMEQLREALFRTAWFDPGFHDDPGHPLRSVLGEATALAFGLPSDAETVDRLRGVVQVLRAHVDAVHGLAAPGDSNKSADDLESYLGHLRAISQLRMSAQIERARTSVQLEVEAMVRGYVLPSAVTNLLRFGIGPLLVSRRLRHGARSETYRAAHTLISRLLSSLEFNPPPGEKDLSEREGLLGELAAGLAEAGKGKDKIGVMLKGLMETYQQFDKPWPLPDELASAVVATDVAPRTELAAASPAQPDAQPITRKAVLGLLSRILRPLQWFRVFEPTQGRTRWLRLAAYYPEQDCIVFDGFDDKERLGLTLAAFALDLSAGRSEPISPDDAARAALDELRRARFK